MPYVKMPSKTQNLWVWAGDKVPAILSLEFFNMPEPGQAPKKGKKAEPSLLVTPEAYKVKPQCQLHLHNMQVVQFELPEDATEKTVLDLLDPRATW